MTAFALATLSTTGTAEAAIHEITSAYCSGDDVGVIDGDGFLEAPGVSDMSKSNFAAPVIASGAVAPFPFISDKPNAKFAEGTSIFGGLDASTDDHPSGAHCVKNALP